MAKLNKDTLTVTDVKAELKAAVTVVNQLTVQLKDRNLVGRKQADVNGARIEALKNMVYLTASGIVYGLLDADTYGVLKANVSKKHFKEAADINELLAKIVKQVAKEPLEGSEYSITELAKLIESPYQYQPVEAGENGVPEVNDVTVVEVEKVDGTVVVVDKTTGTTYEAETEGDHPSTTEGKVKVGILDTIKDFAVKGYTWTKDTVVKGLNLVWDTVKFIAGSILVAIIAAGVFVYNTVNKMTKWTIGLFGKSETTVK